MKKLIYLIVLVLISFNVLAQGNDIISDKSSVPKSHYSPVKLHAVDDSCFFSQCWRPTGEIVVINKNAITSLQPLINGGCRIYLVGSDGAVVSENCEDIK